MGGSCSTRVNLREEMRTILWLENLKRTDHSEDLDVDGIVILELTLGK